MGQYCFARCCLSASSVGVCNAAVGQEGRPPVALAIVRARRVGNRVTDIARRASTVTSR